MNLEIEPYVGASPFIFGIYESSVTSLLGPPIYRTKPPHVPGSEEIDYPGLTFAFNRDRRLMQFGIHNKFHGKVVLKNIDLFQDPDALGKLLALDGNSYRWVGFVMLMGLGLRLGGFDKEEQGGRTISVFEFGRYDAKVLRFAPFP